MVETVTLANFGLNTFRLDLICGGDVGVGGVGWGFGGLGGGEDGWS